MFSSSWTSTTASFVLEPVQQLPAGQPFGMSDIAAPPIAGSNGTGIKLGNSSQQLFSSTVKLVVYGYNTQLHVATMTAASGVRFDDSLSAAVSGTWAQGCEACQWCGMHAVPFVGHVSAWLGADGLLRGTVLLSPQMSSYPPFEPGVTQQTFEPSTPDVVVGTSGLTRLSTDASSGVELLGQHLLLDRNAGLLAVTVLGRTNCTYPACYMDSWRFPSQLHVSAAIPHIPGASFEAAFTTTHYTPQYNHQAAGALHGSLVQDVSVLFDGTGWGHSLSGQYYFAPGNDGHFTLGLVARLRRAEPASVYVWRKKWCVRSDTYAAAVFGGMRLELSPEHGDAGGHWVAGAFVDASPYYTSLSMYEADLQLVDRLDGSSVGDWHADVDAAAMVTRAPWAASGGVGVVQLLATHNYHQAQPIAFHAALMPNSTAFDAAGVMRASLNLTHIHMCSNGTSSMVAQLKVVFTNASHARATVFMGHAAYMGGIARLPEAFTASMAASPELVLNTNATAWGVELTNGVNVTDTLQPLSAFVAFDGVNRLLHGEVVFDLPSDPGFLALQSGDYGACDWVYTPDYSQPYRACFPRGMNFTAAMPGLEIDVSLGQWGNSWYPWWYGYSKLISGRPFRAHTASREVNYAHLPGQWVMQLDVQWWLAPVFSYPHTSSNSTDTPPTQTQFELRFIANIINAFDYAELAYRQVVCRLDDGSSDGFSGNWTAADGQLSGRPFGGSLTLGPAWNVNSGGSQRYFSMHINGSVSSPADHALQIADNITSSSVGLLGSDSVALAWFNATVFMPRHAYPHWLHVISVSIGPAASLELLSDGTRVIEGVASASVSVPCTQFQWGYRQEHSYVGTASLIVAADGTVTGDVRLWSAYLQWYPGCYPSSHLNGGYSTCKFPLALAGVTPTAARTLAVQRSPVEASVALPLKTDMAPLVGSVMSAVVNPVNGSLAATIRVPLVYNSPEYSAISNWQSLGSGIFGMHFPVFAINATLTDSGLQLQLECSSYYWNHPWRVDRCRSGSSMYSGHYMYGGYGAGPGCPYYTASCSIQKLLVSDASGKQISHGYGEAIAIWRPPAGREAAARSGESTHDNSTASSFDGQALSSNNSDNSSQPSYDAELVLALFVNLPLEHVYNYRPSGDDGMDAIV